VTGENPREKESELQRRLHELEWPEPPPGARERGLELLKPHLKLLDSDGNGQSPDSVD
jgi:hypothetical protein